MLNKFLKRYRFEIVSWPILFIGYLLTRLPNLTLIPIFTDEAIYLRWSQIMAFDPALRYLPLTDGKPPLFMWIVSFIIRHFSTVDPLLLGRVTSVGTGLVGLSGIYFASAQLFNNKKISFLSALLYIFIPFTLFYDRFALADSLLAASAIWSLGLGVLLAKKLRLDAALILGACIGLGLLTKTPAWFFLLYLPLYLLLFNFKDKAWKINLIKFAFLGGIVVVVSEAIYSLVKLFPNLIDQKNADFVLSLGEFLKNPLALFNGNAPALLNWEISYLTWPITLIVLTAILFGFQKTREKLLLLIQFAILFLFLSFFNKIIYARFLLTFTPGLLIMAAVGIYEISQRLRFKYSLIVISILLLLLPAWTDYKLYTHPIDATIASNDSISYLNSWSAGFGVKEVVAFLNRQAQKNPKLTVATEGTFGLMPYALELYQKQYPNIDFHAYYPLPNKIPPEISQAALTHPTYFIVYQTKQVPSSLKMNLITSFQQGKSNDYLRLYQVEPELKR